MIQSKNFRSTIQQEKERAAAAHANLAAGISSQIVYQRMLFSLPALGEKQVQQIAGTFLNENIDISGAALYLDGTVVQIYPAQAAERAKVFVDSIQEKDVCLQQIIHDAHSVYLMNGSILTIEEKDYLLYTEKRLNALYAAKAEQMRMICYNRSIASGNNILTFTAPFCYSNRFGTDYTRRLPHTNQIQRSGRITTVGRTYQRYGRGNGAAYGTTAANC